MPGGGSDPPSTPPDLSPPSPPPGPASLNGSAGGRDGAPADGGQPRRFRAAIGWSLGIVATVLAAVLIPPAQSALQDAFEAVTGKQPYTTDVRIGEELVSGPDRKFTASPAAQFWFPRGALQKARPAPGPSPLGCYGSHEWAAANGGADYETTLGNVVITARKTLVVRSLRVETEVLPTKAGDITGCPVGGPLDAEYLSIDLDTRTATLVDSTSAGEARPSPYFGFQLNAGQSEAIVFAARSGQEKRLRWKLILEAVVDGHRIDIPIDDHGKPFELVAGRNPLNTNWVHTGSGWVLNK
jgi:hypothetical protein